MKPNRRPFALLLLLSLITTACVRDPQVRKQKFLKAAQEFSAKGEHERAVIQLKNALRVDPKFGQACFMLAKEYEASHLYGMALRSLLNCVKVDPGNKEAHLWLGDIYVQMGHTNEALEQAQAVLATDPFDVQAALVMASAYRADGRFKNATETLNSVLDRQPNNTRALRELAAIRFVDKDVKGAEELLTKVAEIGGHKLESIEPLVELYLRSGDPAKAVSILEEAVKKEPQSVGALNALGRVYAVLGKLPEAEGMFRRIRDLPAAAPTERALLGDFYGEIGLLEKARQEYDALHNKNPKEVDITKRLIAVLLTLDKTADAERLLTPVLRDHPRDAFAIVLEARVHFAQKRMDDAVNDLNRAIHLEPTLAVAHFHLAEVRLAQQNLPLAKNSLGDALKYDPKMSAARLLLARLELQSGNAAQARANIESLMRSDPRLLTPYLMHASSLIQSKDFTKAEKELGAILNGLPANMKTPRAAAYVLLAEAASAKGDVAGERSNLEKALAASPEQAAVLSVEMTNSYLRQGQSEKALELLKAKLKEQPENPELLATAGRLYLEKGDYADAEGLLKKAVAKPQSASKQAEINLGYLYVSQGRQADAQAQFENLLRKYPKDAEVRRYNAWFHMKAGRTEQARKEYGEAYSLDPVDVQGLNNLAWLEANSPQGNIDVALKLAQDAREKAPTRADVADTLGVILIKKNQYSMAARTLEDSVRIAPNKPLYAYHLGLAYLGKEDKVQAKKWLEKALQSGQFEGAKDAAEKLAALR